MSLKNYSSLLSCSILLLSFSCSAGQIAQYQTSESLSLNKPQIQQTFTAHINAGYSLANWSDSYSYNFTSNGDTSFAFGLDLTRTLNRYINLQSSLIYTPDVDYDDNGGHSISQWLTTTMAEINYPLSNSTRYFFGAGLGIRHTNFDGDKSFTIRPTMSVGLQFKLNDYWELQSQYLRVNNVGDDSHGNYIPVSNIISCGIGYSF
ncbi:MAG: hypothetical protein CL816_00390 [Coxiellaceae bacterium]|nr:hypothetical protein [Coxiellaceae bacterium]